jgi:hypothetical protein
MDGKVHDVPSSVASEEGQVIVDGPDAVAVTMTPKAAEETGQRLISSASDAAGYNRLNNRSDGEEVDSEPGEQAAGDLPD